MQIHIKKHAKQQPDIFTPGKKAARLQRDLGLHKVIQDVTIIKSKHQSTEINKDSKRVKNLISNCTTPGVTLKSAFSTCQ